ncbi:hypothetical protein DFH06DRAFT_1140038 [Mycena polygramma]|nr:hypothetical protein DFH06DRAFT_1140038 [Mycena polygramma]
MSDDLDESTGMLPGSPAFLLFGIAVQDEQRCLNIEAEQNHQNPDLDGKKDLEIHDRRTALRARIVTFRQMQQLYMPNAFNLLSARDRLDWNSLQYRHPERVPLFMPSEIRDTEQRHESCVLGLPWLEYQLRCAEVNDANSIIESLSVLRDRATSARNREVRGSRQHGRCAATIVCLSERIEEAQQRLSRAELAMERLQSSVEGD